MENYLQVYNVLSLPLSLFMAYEKSKADGKIDVGDIQYLVGPLLRLPSVIDGAKNSVVEFKMMSDADRATCLQKLSAEFDIADDVLEQKIESAIEWIFATGKLLGVFTK